MRYPALTHYLLLLPLFLFCPSAGAISVSWGALATSAISSCDPSGLVCDINSNEAADGGSDTASASTLIDDDPRGISSASSTLSGSAMTPSLGALANAGSGDNLVQSGAAGIQAYTNLDVARSITLDFALSTGPLVGTGWALLAQVSVFRASELVFIGDTLEEIVIDPVLLDAFDTQTLVVSPLVPGLPTSGSLAFDVLAGEDFLVFALLLAQAEDGSIADASNTLTIELLESDNPLGPGQLDIASLKVNDIPLPPAAWLFLSAIGLLAGVSSRRRAGALPDSPKFG